MSSWYVNFLLVYPIYGYIMYKLKLDDIILRRLYVYDMYQYVQNYLDISDANPFDRNISE